MRGGRWARVAGIVLLAACSKSPPHVDAVDAAPATPVASTPPAPRPTVALERVGDGRTGSTVVLARWAGHTVAFVADEDEPAVRAVDLDAARELSSTKLASRPGQLLVTGDGRLLVAMRDEGAVASFRATDDPSAPLVPAERATTATEPIALAETPDDARLLVASGWGHAFEAFDARTLERKLALDVAREPRAVTTSSDGATAFVAHASASQVTSIDLGSDAPKPEAIDLGTHPYSGGDDASGPDFPGRVARGAFAIARVDGKRERFYVPYTLVDPGNALAIARGYGDAGGSVVGMAMGPMLVGNAGEFPKPSPVHGVVVPTAGTHAFDVHTVIRDPRKRDLGGKMPMVVEDTTRGGKGACVLPRAAVVDAVHMELLVACLGVDEVRALDATKDDPTGWKPRRRWSVPAGANGIAVDAEHDRAVVWSAFDGVVSVLSLTRPAKGVDAATPEPVRIPLARTKPLPADVALGRTLFFRAGDPRIAKDGRACASCHIDGREDGLVWSSPQGPRQTMMLAGRADHLPPFGWLGEHPTVQVHLAQTFKNLAGTGLEPGEMDALAAWLRVMKGPPAPSHEETPLEAHGREVFQSAAADCSSCHVDRGGFTDHLTHDVGSGANADKSAAFVTPSLRFLGGTAPYFHDGRYATLDALLKDPKGKMGSARNLPEGDRAALEAYLRTL